MIHNYGHDDPKNDETNLSYLKTLKTSVLEDMCDPEHAPFYGDKELDFAKRMSELLYDMRLEDIGSVSLMTDSFVTIPKEYMDKILADETHVGIIKNIIRMSVLESVTECPKLYMKNDKSEYVYTAPDTYDHAYAMDSYIEKQYIKDNPVMTDVYICEKCGGENVLARVWVLPNKQFQLSKEQLSKTIKYGYCTDCDDLVKLNIVQKPLEKS